MIRRILITSTVLTALAAQTTFFANAQTRVVRETVPTQKQVIIANSPQDIALQEEIRRIRAFNAVEDSKVGISDSYTSDAPEFSAPLPRANRYEGRTIELFEAPETQITYASSIAQPITTSAAIVERQIVTNSARTYSIAAGDTLYRLAKSNCISVADIQNQNGLSDNNINIGQAITLPASQCGASTIAVTAAPTTRSEFGIIRKVMPIQTGINVRDTNSYAVLPKDSLYSIGRRYCVTAGDLAGFNGIDISTPIQPGQNLRLPENACK